MEKCINRLEKKDMNILISAMGSYDDSASFWTNFIFLKKNDFKDFSTSPQTPPMMPKYSPKAPNTFWKKLIFDPKNLSGTCPDHDQKMHFFYKKNILFLQKKKIFFLQKKKIGSKVDMSKKLKNVKNDFFPELFGKLPYGFLHHHWCLGRGLEGLFFFFQKNNFDKKCPESPPEHFATVRKFIALFSCCFMHFLIFPNFQIFL